MALHVPKAPGFSSMMKDGSKFFSGLEEAVIRNIGKENLNLSFPKHMAHLCWIKEKRIHKKFREIDLVFHFTSFFELD